MTPIRKDMELFRNPSQYEGNEGIGRSNPGSSMQCTARSSLIAHRQPL